MGWTFRQIWPTLLRLVHGQPIFWTLDLWCIFICIFVILTGLTPTNILNSLLFICAMLFLSIISVFWLTVLCRCCVVGEIDWWLVGQCRPEKLKPNFIINIVFNLFVPLYLLLVENFPDSKIGTCITWTCGEYSWVVP